MCSVHRFLNKVQFIINYTYDLLMTIFFWDFLLAFSSALSSSLFKELHQMVKHCFCWTDAEVQKCCHLRGPTHFRRLSTIVSSQRVFRVTTSGMICSFGGVLPNFFLSTSSVTKGNLWDRGSIAKMDDGYNQSGLSLFSRFHLTFVVLYYMVPNFAAAQSMALPLTPYVTVGGWKCHRWSSFVIRLFLSSLYFWIVLTSFDLIFCFHHDLGHLPHYRLASRSQSYMAHLSCQYSKSKGPLSNRHEEETQRATVFQQGL